jgi:hypothetical protein
MPTLSQVFIESDFKGSESRNTTFYGINKTRLLTRRSGLLANLCQPSHRTVVRQQKPSTSRGRLIDQLRADRRQSNATRIKSDFSQEKHSAAYDVTTLMEQITGQCQG